MLRRILALVFINALCVFVSSTALAQSCPDGQERVCADECEDDEKLACVPTKCASGEVMCEGACTDLRSDDQHCGACGRVCKREEACMGGRCELVCPAIQLACGNVCVSPASDPNHCGGCNLKCGADQYCKSGVCEQICPASMQVCGRTCRDTKVDKNNCGACGKVCRRDEVCDGGQCVAACIDPQPVDKVDPKDIQTGTVPVTVPKKKKPRLRKR